MIREQEKIYQFWIHNLPGVGDATIEKMLAAFGDEQTIYRVVCGKSEEEKAQLRRIVHDKNMEAILAFSKTWDLEGTYDKMRKNNICFLTREDEEYPKRIRKLEKPPFAIYYMGKLPEEDKPSLAVIGARECSEYGTFIAQSFAGKLSAAGIEIISGMARGIDGIAQQAAIDNGGRTYAVLGNGVDVCYPASNRGLYDRILETGGGIISVYPPGAEPQKRQFPERNRIVAGLSDVLLVVEARQKSGTWITVDMALEQGKNVYAVPGRLTDRLSDGCNMLIRQGAGIALAPEDILAEFSVLLNRKEVGGISETFERKEESKNEDILPFLDSNPRTIEEILDSMRKRGICIEVSELLTQLIGLCMEGKAKQAGGSFLRSHL